MRRLISIVIVYVSLLLMPQTSLAQDCTGSSPTQLYIGLVTQVAEGNSLNIRTAPEQGNIIATLPTNVDFTIADGAICGAQDGLRWWFIDWDGTQGWIAEGNLDETWINPPPPPVMFFSAGDEPAATPIPATAIPATSVPEATAGILFNDLQYVAEDDGLRFWLDLSITDYANRDLSIFLWFVDAATNDYLQNPAAYETYINSSDILYLSYDLLPCCQSVTYGIGDIHMFMPYDQLPDGDFVFYPQVTIYDENVEFIAEQSFTDLQISRDAELTTGSTIHKIEHQFADEGIWFLVDMTVTDRMGEDLSAYVWFMDDITGEFIKNPIASEDHRNNSDALFIKTDIQPTSALQTYTGTDLSLYIPYHEFPRSLTSYTPFVTLYDADLNEIDQQHFEDVVIQSTDHPAPTSGILIRDVTFEFGDDGIRYYVDMDTVGFAGQELEVIAFFRDYGDEYISSALPIDDYYNTDEGLIIGFATIEPCCTTQQAFSGENRVEIYVPYNVFPVGTYSYYPVISVNRIGERDALKSRFFRDKAIDVLGDEPPAGYIVNYRIDELIGTHPINNNGMANSGPEWDDLLLVYSLYELDKAGELIPGDQRYWTKHVWPRTIHHEGFETILLDVLADSSLVVRMEFTEVVDLEATEEAVDSLRDVGKAARRGTRFLPRVFRIAAKSAARYVNGMLLFYDIKAFFEKDNLFHTSERVITPIELLKFYQVTGARGEEWLLETEVMSGGGYSYEISQAYWLYGYAHHRARDE